LPDIAVAEIPVDEEERPLPPPEPRARNALVDGAILPTLLRLAWPNVIALSAGTCVVIAETSYIGRLGVEALAAMALVFPCVILTMTMSGGAMGGGVASAIARALGAGDNDRASTLAAHALLIGISFGLTFMLGMLVFGPRLLELLGGRGNVLAQAMAYVQIFFGGAVVPWLMNTMAGVLRGTGNMKLPSLMMLSSAVCQVILGGTLGLGLGPVPQFGMRGVAAGSLIAYIVSISVMGWYLFSGRARVIPKIRGLRIEWGMFIDILKVGAVSCLSPLQSVLTISIFTHLLAGFGTAILAGYGIGARLEFMLTSVAFSIGIASVPMIGMAMAEPLLQFGALMHDADMAPRGTGTSLLALLRGRDDPMWAVRAAGRAVAAFHLTGRAMGPRDPLAERIRDVERAASLLEWACPEVGDDIRAVAATVVADPTEAPPAPIHGDLKADHLFVAGDRVTFIDFDRLGVGDPVGDAARVYAYLTARVGLDGVPAERARAAAAAFVDAYFTHVPAEWRERFALQYAGALLEVASGLFRSQAPGWRGMIRDAVAEACRALSPRWG